MIDQITTLLKVERVDDVPVLLNQMHTMQLTTLLDQFFPTDGHWEGALSFGGVVTGWLSFILSEGDHRLSHVEDWAADHTLSLSAGLGGRVRPLDFSDDRLGYVLDRLADTPAWSAFETALDRGLLRVYALPSDTARIDSTSAKSYARVTADGLFQFGHSKDHRPDLAQVKVNLSVLDPLGLPLTTTVLSGQCADDPLYVPEIERVQQVWGRGGKTYVGDCKMAALATRAYVAHSQDYYVCPLAGTQMSAETLDALLEPVWRGEQPLRTVYHPQRAANGARVVIAQGYAVSVPLTATWGDQTVEWTERRLVVRSLAWARRQTEHLEQRLQATVAEIERLNGRKQGKPRRTADELRAAAEQIIQRRGVAGLLRLTVRTRTRRVRKRKYGARPEQEIEQIQSTIGARRDRAAARAAQRRFGWRVYGTNHPTLALPAVVLTYRGQYCIERGFGRFKGRALSLTPLLLHTDDRVIGLIRLLSLGLRVLTLLEFVVRRQLADTGQTIAGLYAGQPKRPLARPTAEAILRVFKGLSVAVVQTGRQRQAMLLPLRPLQQRLLQLLGCSADMYERVVDHFSKPALNLSET